MSSPEKPTEVAQPGTAVAAPRSVKRNFAAAVISLFGAFAAGGAVTAVALQSRQPALVMLTPAPIVAMHDASAVAVKGEVSEIFGNKFVIQDETGRALVETGPRGDGGKLVAKSETVTVQGRFDNGFIHAQAISHGDGRNDLVGPPAPPPGGPLAWRGPAAGPGRPGDR